MKDLTQVLNGVVSLFVVHFNGLGMRAADPIADGVTPHHNVLVLRGRPAHYNAVHKWPHMQGARDVWHSCLWNQRTSKITLCHPNQAPAFARYLPVFTVQIALKRLSSGPVCSRTRAIDRNGRHSQHIFSASLQTWKIQEELQYRLLIQLNLVLQIHIQNLCEIKSAKSAQNCIETVWLPTKFWVVPRAPLV